jgi:non-specific serine/threonine protein kinase
MLETIREYAAERLEEAGEADDLRRRHAEHFVGLAEEAEPHLRRDSPEWADRLEREHDNLRAALDRLEAAGEGALLRLAGALHRFWYLKSHLTEGKGRLERALEADPRPTAARAKALYGLSVMELNLGDPAAARRLAEEALTLNRAVDDAWGTAYSTMMVGNATAESKDLADARPVLEESVRLFQELGDELYVLIASSNLAWVTGDLGDHQAERVLIEENLIRARKLGNRRMEAGALGNLAIFARDEGRLDDAVAMTREAIRIDHRLGNLLDLAIELGRLASIVALAGRAAHAARLLASADALIEQLGANVFFWAADRNEQTRAAIRSQIDEGAFARATEEGRALSVDEAVELALEA